ncbi:MAG: hypothetical protein HY677_02000 [Chloroflexi bacterium]|nr:hypothetical protein [Chloroflexota bacterium]
MRWGIIAVILVYLALGVAYAVRTPTWQAPDEPAHFNYVKYIATHGALPVLKQGDYDQAYLEELKAAKFSPDKPIDSVRYESHQPPLYYLTATPIYLAVRSLPLRQQVLVLRIYSLLLGTVLLSLGYAITRRIFPRKPSLQVAVPAFVALVPQHLAMSAAINNDTFAEVILAAVLLASVRLVLPFEGRQALGWRSAVVFGLLAGTVLLTKTTIYVGILLIPMALLLRVIHDGKAKAILRAALPVLAVFLAILIPELVLGVALLGVLRLLLRKKRTLPKERAAGAQGFSLRDKVIGAWQDREGRQLLRSIVPPLLIVVFVAVVVAGWWFIRDMAVYGVSDPTGLRRHDAVVIDQPRTGQFDASAAKRFFVTGYKSFWAQLGWMGVPASNRIYELLGVVSIASGLGLLLFAGRRLLRPLQLSASQRSALLLLLTSFALVFLAWFVYNLTFIQPQGRYLFPALIPIGTFFALGLNELSPQRLGKPALLIALLVLLYVNRYALTQMIPYLS